MPRMSVAQMIESIIEDNGCGIFRIDADPTGWSANFEGCEGHGKTLDECIRELYWDWEDFKAKDPDWNGDPSKDPMTIAKEASYE